MSEGEATVDLGDLRELVDALIEDHGRETEVQVEHDHVRVPGMRQKYDEDADSVVFY